MEARRWIGTPWHHQASLRGVGSDCIGLISGVAKELGMPEAAAFETDPEIRGYGKDPVPHLLLAACARYLDPVDVRAARMGDIFLMRFKEPRHFAMLTCRAPEQIIHAYAQMRKVTETGLDAVWRGRIVSAWRYRGVSDG